MTVAAEPLRAARGGPAIPSRRAIVGLAAACMGLSALSIDLLLPAFGDMRTAFGLAPDSTEVSSLITVFFIGLAFGQLVFGPLSDRFGRRPMLLVGLAVVVVAASAAATMPSLSAVLVCRFLWGFGVAAPRTIALAIVRDSQHGDDMARTMSMAMAIFLIVPIFAPMAGAVLLLLGSWRLTLWVPALVTVALIVWVTRRLPETLPTSNRRSVTPRALGDAFGQVVRTRVTLVLGLAVTFLFGAMASFIGSVEVVVDDVFGQADLFVFLFGIVGCMLGLGALLNARLVMRFGMRRMLRAGSIYTVVAVTVMVLVASIDHGKPPLWAFGPAVALTLPGITMLVPNCNTAAMAPLGHVAGMGAAVLGAASTAGGSLLGLLTDRAFDGTVQPFAFHLFVYVCLGAAAIHIGIRRIDH
jgi:DHA1 family bicyclomycin/chloramphenicol resistance-like MFS transporter